jgi:hypothetical protein
VALPEQPVAAPKVRSSWRKAKKSAEELREERAAAAAQAAAANRARTQLLDGSQLLKQAETLQSGVRRQRRAMLIDGYNYLHAHPQLSKLCSGMQYAIARNQLQALLSQSGLTQTYDITIIWDNQYHSEGSDEVTSSGVRVVYTPLQEADTYILRHLSTLNKQAGAATAAAGAPHMEGAPIYIVSNDKRIQEHGLNLPHVSVTALACDALTELIQLQEQRARRSTGSVAPQTAALSPQSDPVAWARSMAATGIGWNLQQRQQQPRSSSSGASKPQQQQKQADTGSKWQERLEQVKAAQRSSNEVDLDTLLGG